MEAREQTYVFDQRWQEERGRLEGIEALWDAGSAAALEQAGVGPGWSCVEVGAGRGSMVEWLSDRTGPEGHVLATDLDTRFLDAIERDNVTVATNDVLTEDLPGAPFDLVYSRLVVEHLGVSALERMVAAVKPGGVLVLEDYDFSPSACHPADENFERVTEAVLDFMSAAGFDPNFGRTLPTLLTDAGLEDVHADGRVRIVRGGSHEVAFYRLTLFALRVPLVDSGRLTDTDFDATLAGLEDPGRTFLSPVLVAARGRRP